MFLRQPLRQLRLPRYQPSPPFLFRAPNRFSSSSTSNAPHARLQRILNRLPSFLQPYTSALVHAPTAHIVSFLILHEITAVVPLVGLSLTFHYTDWLPQGWTQGKYVTEGVERFGRWFGRKGWFGFSNAAASPSSPADQARNAGEGADVSGRQTTVEDVEARWNVSESGGKILIEVATAYAITKVFLPARVLVSVWGTPWFARAVLGRFRGLFRLKGKGNEKGI